MATNPPLFAQTQKKVDYQSMNPGQANTANKPSATGVTSPAVPQEVVELMLKMAKVTKNDVVYDLGSGDGRIPITAANKYGARAIGIEIRPELVQQARDNAKQAEVDHQTEFL